jgi:F0F1-type ATP synthase membrane subunit b/b'
MADTMERIDRMSRELHEAANTLYSTLVDDAKKRAEEIEELTRNEADTNLHERSQKMLAEAIRMSKHAGSFRHEVQLLREELNPGAD